MLLIPYTYLLCDLTLRDDPMRRSMLPHESHHLFVARVIQASRVVRHLREGTDGGQHVVRVTLHSTYGLLLL
jgi:hypothetical protein